MYYEKLSKLPCEEDMTHEFKGHRNFCIEELPKWALASKTEKASRKPISRWVYVKFYCSADKVCDCLCILHLKRLSSFKEGKPSITHIPAMSLFRL